jgi:hypothetical protein|tara:strand:+ start:1111 stop:1371 length:261 start_codon:yes stop_codon:yes gene_type:complete
MRLRKPSKYQGRIRASSFDRIARRQVSSYPSHATPEILLAIREYLVKGLSPAKTSYRGTRQAFRSRLIYYINIWENKYDLNEKDLK